MSCDAAGLPNGLDGSSREAVASSSQEDEKAKGKARRMPKFERLRVTGVLLPTVAVPAPRLPCPFLLRPRARAAVFLLAPIFQMSSIDL